MKRNIALIWLGNFGYAILHHLDNNIDYQNYNISGYDINQEIVDWLKVNKKHPYLFTDFSVSDNIQFYNSLQETVKDADIIILAIFSQYIIEVLNDISSYTNKKIIILNTSKALSKDWNPYSLEIKNNIQDLDYEYGILSGWTIAKDMFNPNCVLWGTLAFDKYEITQEIKNLFESKTFKIEISNDVLWVEYAWAFKNIGSILMWYLSGKGYEYWMQTYILTRFSKEIIDFVVRYLWWEPTSFAITSQCWGNDFFMSATGNTRNRQFWELLWKWNTFQQALDFMNSQDKLVEWEKTLKSLKKIFKNKNIDTKQFPVLNACISLLDDGFAIEL